MKEFFTALAMVLIIIAIAHWQHYIDLSVLVDSTLFIDHSYYFGG
jgi:hypothetical protein